MGLPAPSFAPSIQHGIDHGCAESVGLSPPGNPLTARIELMLHMREAGCIDFFHFDQLHKNLRK